MQPPPDETAPTEPPPALAAAEVRARETGWCRIDGDAVVRGWVVDHGDMARRVAVDILVDGVPVGSTVADEERPELDFADKHHGLSFKLPLSARDGAPHVFTVRTAAGFELRTKMAAFEIAPEGPVRLSKLDLTHTRLKGEIEHAGAVKWPFIHVYGAGERPSLFPVKWGPGQGPRLTFWGELDGALLHEWLAADAVLSYHGEDPAAGIPIWSLVGTEWAGGAAHVALRLSGIPLSRPLDIDLAFDGAAAPPVPGRAVTNQTYRFELPPGLPAEWSARAELRTAAGAVVLGHFSRSAPPTGWLQNPVFETWDGDAPAVWAVSGAETKRGASPGLITETGTHTDNTLVLIPSGTGPVRLQQPIVLPGAAENLQLAVVGRGTRPASLDWRLESAGGDALGSGTLPIGRNWGPATAALTLPPDCAGPASLIIEAPAGTTALELAAIDLGPGDRRLTLSGDLPSNARQARPLVNLVRNPDLLDWPDGRLPVPGAANVDMPDGWRITNMDSPAPASISLVPVQLLDPSSTRTGYGLSLEVDAVARGLRIEIELDVLNVAVDAPFQVHFHATPATGRDLFAGTLHHAARWAAFSRVFLLARNIGLGTSQIIARFRRGLVLQPGRSAYSLDAIADEMPPDWTDADCTFHLCFEVDRPCRLTLDSIELAQGQSGQMSAEAGGRFEDPNILAQMHQVSLAIPAAGRAGNVTAGRSAADMRWQWDGRSSTGVEIVVCVHDALEETIACLQSIETATAIPHTVLIVNDASNPRSRMALEAFIAGKPWMRMVSNAENRGYTRSADSGIRQSRAELVVLLNSDTIVHPNWLERMIACLRSDPAIAFVGPLSNAATYQSVPELRDAQGRWAVNALPEGMDSAALAAAVEALAAPHYPRVPLLNGFCTLMRREVFLEIGGLDGSAFPTGYGEENDLCLRVRKAGYELAVADDVYVWHSKSASFGGARRAELQKAGDKALREKHADIDFGEIGRRFAEIPALIQIRDQVRTLYRPGGGA